MKLYQRHNVTARPVGKVARGGLCYIPAPPPAKAKGSPLIVTHLPIGEPGDTLLERTFLTSAWQHKSEKQEPS